MTLSTGFHRLLKPLLSSTPSRTLSLPPASPNPFAKAIRRHHTLPIAPYSPIIGLLTPQPHALSAFLLEKGFLVRPVVPPTVPPGGERVRICLRAEMDVEVVKGLMGALESWVKRAEAGKEQGLVRSRGENNQLRGRSESGLSRGLILAKL